MKKWITGTAVAAALGAAIVVIPASSLSAQVPGFLTLEGPGSAIGVTVREATADDAKTAKLAEASGVVIESVRSESPAARAGLRAGDLVLELDGERIRSTRHFTRVVRETPPGRTVDAVVVRDGSRQTLRVTPEVTGELSGNLSNDRGRPSARLRVAPDILRDFNFNFERNAPRLAPSAGRARLGITLSPLGTQLAEYFGVKEGVLVASVESGTPAADAGLKAGDVITAIGGRAVSSAQDVTAAVRRVEAGSGFDIAVTRDRMPLMLKATLPPANRATPSGRGGLPV